MIYDDHAAYLVAAHEINLEELRDMLIDGSPLFKKHRAYLSHLLIELIQDRDSQRYSNKERQRGRPSREFSNNIAVLEYWESKQRQGIKQVDAHAMYVQERTRSLDYKSFQEAIRRGRHDRKKLQADPTYTATRLAYSFGVSTS